MVDSIFAQTAKLLDERGWLPKVPADPTDRHGRLTLRQALRDAAGLESAAWLPAYIDWTTSTASYVRAHQELETILSSKRDGQPTDPEWWQGQTGRTVDEVRQLLEQAKKAAPRLARSDPSPRLRSGCTTKLVSSLQVSGVVVAAAASAMRTTNRPLGKTVLEAIDGDALGDLSSEGLVAAFDLVASAEEVERDVALRQPPWRDIPAVCREWHAACIRSVALRPGRVLATTAELGSLDLARTPDEVLTEALTAFRAAPADDDSKA